jgi:signal transduction histidine kinase
MKSIKRSFLFFYTLSSLLLFTSTQNAVAQQSKDSLKHYKKLAIKPQNANDLFKARDYFKNNYDKAIAIGDIESAVIHLYYLASIDYKKGEYNTGEATAVKALGLINTMKTSSFLETHGKSFYNLLGLIYTEQKNKSKAIELYNSALKISKSASDSVNIYNNISLVYKDFDDLDNARLEIQKAYSLLPRIKDTLIQALVLDNYGIIASKINKEDGLTLMKTALQLRISVNDTSRIFTSYSSLANYYYGISDLEASRKYALLTYKLANKINSPSYKNMALGLLTNLSADGYAKAYKKLNDSLYLSDKASSNKFALLKYDNSNYKRKAWESELEKEIQESKTTIAILVTTFITILSFFLYYIIQSRHKKEKLQQVYATESRISKQIHDDVSNDLFQVMTKLESKDQIGEELKEELHTLYYRTRDISKEHSLIHKEYPIIEYLGELIESFNDDKTSVIVKGVSDISWDTVEDLKRTTIYKVLQELLINMRKHSEASIVVLSFKKQDKKIYISYSDNGIGCDLKMNTGLHNTENRINSINGIISFDTEPNKGFKVKISI